MQHKAVQRPWRNELVPHVVMEGVGVVVEWAFVVMDRDMCGNGKGSCGNIWGMLQIGRCICGNGRGYVVIERCRRDNGKCRCGNGKGSCGNGCGKCGHGIGRCGNEAV